MKRLPALLAAALLPLALAAAPSGSPGPVIYPGAPPAPAVGRAAPASGFGLAGAVFLAACAGGGLWLWWRGRRPAPGGAGRGDRQLVIFETRPLGNRQYLVVAAYQERKYLLGVCPGRIDLLAPLGGDRPSAP